MKNKKLILLSVAAVLPNAISMGDAKAAANICVADTVATCTAAKSHVVKIGTLIPFSTTGGITCNVITMNGESLSTMANFVSYLSNKAFNSETSYYSCTGVRLKNYPSGPMSAQSIIGVYASGSNLGIVYTGEGTNQSTVTETNTIPADGYNYSYSLRTL